MKLAKASQAEIDALMKWLQDRENKEDGPPPYMRVVFGYETLVQNCCDPAKDYLDFKEGTSPSDIEALRADKARLDWLKVEPYERIQKVREWLPISYVPPAPDNLRAAIDNAMKHDPNFRP